jgi:anti-sigma factor RsiW
MSTHECRDIRPSLGAYALGALDIAEAEFVRAHLDRCAECAAEAADMHEMANVLSLTDLEMIEKPPSPSADVLPNLLRRVSAARRRRRVAGAIAAAAAAAVVTVAGVIVANDDAPSQEPSATEPAATVSGQEGSVAVEVDLWERDWGTALTVEVSGVPAGYRCSLVAIGADGERETAATWVVPQAGYDGGSSLTMDGTHGLRSWEVDRYEVVTSDGELLATLPMDH